MRKNGKKETIRIVLHYTYMMHIVEFPEQLKNDVVSDSGGEIECQRT